MKLLLAILTILGLSSSKLWAWTYKQLPMESCEWCGTKLRLNRHHVIPQSVDPSLKHNRMNLIVLCRKCHFVLGHRCNWRTFNPDVLTICNKYSTTMPCKRGEQ